MMLGDYRLTEPHPTPATNVVFSGRGGFGNKTKVSKAKGSLTHGPTATGPPSLTRLTSASSTSTSSSSGSYYLSGRGGAGNALPTQERAIFSFDEELAAQSRMMESAAPVYHVGRGGSGNAVHEGRSARMMDQWSWLGGNNSADSQASSTSSNSSGWSGEAEKQKAKRGLEGAWHRVSKPFLR